MTFNFLTQNKNNLETLTHEEALKLVKNQEAEHFFYKIRTSMFGIKVFLLYMDKVYFLNRKNGMSYYERVHRKDYLNLLKEARNGK